jgi:hypothetical protein
MGTPVGVALLGALALFNGIGGLIIGARYMGFVTFGPAQTGSGLFLMGLIAFIYGVLFIALAYAAWTLRAWAWLAGMLLSVLGLFNAVLVLLSTGDLASGVAVALLPAIVLWYLNQDSMKARFVEGEERYQRYGGSGYDREQAERITAERSTD